MCGGCEAFVRWASSGYRSSTQRLCGGGVVGRVACVRGIAEGVRRVRGVGLVDSWRVRGGWTTGARLVRGAGVKDLGWLRL